MPRVLVPVVTVVVALLLGPVASVHADDDRWNVAAALQAPKLPGFDPDDPRVGLALIAARGLGSRAVARGVRRDLRAHPLDVVGLLVASRDGAAANWGFADSLDRPLDVDLGEDAISPPPASPWNLGLLAAAAGRILVGDAAQRVGPLEPSFFPFTFDGGGGVVTQWQN